MYIKYTNTGIQYIPNIYNIHIFIILYSAIKVERASLLIGLELLSIQLLQAKETRLIARSSESK